MPPGKFLGSIDVQGDQRTTVALMKIATHLNMHARISLHDCHTCEDHRHGRCFAESKRFAITQPTECHCHHCVDTRVDRQNRHRKMVERISIGAVAQMEPKQTRIEFSDLAGLESYLCPIQGCD